MKKKKLYEVNKKGYGELREVEIVREGTFNDFKITKKILQTWIDKFEEQKAIGYELPVHIGHTKGNDDTKQAEGLITSLKLKGSSLVANIRGLTAKFLDEIKKYPYRSIEASVKELYSLALLGATTPAVRNEPIVLKNKEEEIFFGQMLSDSLNAKGADDKYILFNKNIMKKFVEMLSEVKGQTSISKSDIEKLQGAFLMLSEEEQEEVKEELDTVEETVEEKEGEESKDEEKKEEKEGEAEGKLEKVEAELSETKKLLAEMAPKAKLAGTYEKKLSEIQGEVDKMKSEARTKVLSERVENELQLSSTRTIGLNKESSEKMVKLLAELTDKQSEVLFSILEGIKNVSLEEEGHAEPVIENEEELDKQAEELSQKEGITYGAALKKLV